MLGRSSVLAPLLVLLALHAPAATAGPTCLGRAATIEGNDSSNVIEGTAGDDVIVGKGGHDDIGGRGGNDRICGGGGDDDIRGGRGRDRIEGGPHSDDMFGNEGVDRVSYAMRSRGVHVTIDGIQDDGAFAGGEGDNVWPSVENLIGSAGVDELSGDQDPNLLVGGSGGDELSGRGDGDRILGSVGPDFAAGGLGADDMYGHRGNDLLIGDEGDDYANGGPGTEDTCVAERKDRCEHDLACFHPGPDHRGHLKLFRAQGTTFSPG